MKVRGKGTIVALEKPERTCTYWQLRVPVGLDYLSKEYKTKTRRVHGTITEARRKLRNFIAELENGTTLDAGTVTLGTFASEWMRERETNTVKPPRKGTLRNNDLAVRTIQKSLGGILLKDLNAEHIAAFYSRLMSGEASLSGRPLSGTSARKVSVVLSQVLDKAVKRHLIPSNPCKLLDADERPRVDTKERQPLTDADAKALIAALYDGMPDAHRMGATLAIECGLRREELLALSWGDVDLLHGIVHVCGAYTADDEAVMPTKSRKGNRYIPITGSPLHHRLAEWQQVQSSRLSALGIKQVPATPVVTNREGGRIHPNSFYRWWRAFCEKCGIRSCGLHTLRHTYATALGRRGVDVKTIQTLIGDSTGDVALNIYMHYNPENGRNAMSEVSSFFHGGMGVSPGSETRASNALESDVS
ncbi:site-specific integrase [Olsenella sp. Marseille-P4559]|uniref:tyrosine-type recombinase/integrase n=1 Tax=Olsenella sp. Marseille-P4559 TaxID=2364795 RepID=UPI001031653C|nr:site-specific integrase [Olsenella sp. Marseille-P4559]